MVFFSQYDSQVWHLLLRCEIRRVSRSNCASTHAKFVGSTPSLFTIRLHNTHISRFDTFMTHTYRDLSVKCLEEFSLSRDTLIDKRILWLISLRYYKFLPLSLTLQTMPIFILDRRYRVSFIRSILSFSDWTHRTHVPCIINETNRLLRSFFLQVARSIYSQGKVNHRWCLLRLRWDIMRSFQKWQLWKWYLLGKGNSTENY